MKSILGKLGVILVVIGFTISSYVEAWGVDWKFYDIGGTGTFWWYDAQGVTICPNRVIRVWGKKVKADDILEMIKSGAKLTVPDIEQMASERSCEWFLIEIDCVKRTYNYIQRLQYDSKGALKSGVLESDNGNIEPKHVEETLYKIVCK
jgi:hypothetical protein